MPITISLRHTGINDNALKFAKEMISGGTVDAIRSGEGNLRYEYYQSLDNPQTILLIDSWASQDSGPGMDFLVISNHRHYYIKYVY